MALKLDLRIWGQMKSKDRDKYLRREYGITLKDYNEMLKKQNHSCAICKRHKSHFMNSLAVDHDHKTEAVRGLLCFYCNKRFVGRHTGESVKKLVEYLLPDYELRKKA